MKYLITFLLLACTGFSAFSQIVEWESFIQGQRAGKPLDTGEWIWVPTNAGLVAYEKATASATLYNKTSGGLVSNSIEAIAQHPLTNDLYIGTYDLALMVRPAGSTTWAPLPYPESFTEGQEQMVRTYCMDFDEAGVLWIGTDIGLLSYDNGTWAHWENTGNAFYGGVWDLGFSLEGDLLIGSHGVFRKEGEELVLLSPETNEGGDHLFAYGNCAIHQAKDEQLWFITDLGTVGAYDGEQWNHITEIPPLNIFNAALSFVEPEPGQLRVLVPTRYRYFWDGSTWTQEGTFEEWKETLYQQGLPDGQQLTVTTTTIEVEGDEAVPYTVYPFESSLFQFVKGPGGDLWAKDQQAGIHKLSTGEQFTVDGTGGAPAVFNRYTLAPDGSFWCTSLQSVFHYSAGGWTAYNTMGSPFLEGYNWTLYPGLSGAEVWMTAYGSGLYHFTGEQWQLQDHPAFSEWYIFDVAAVPGGVYLVLIDGSESTTAFWDGAVLTELEQGDQGFEDVQVSDLHYDSATDRLWALGYTSLQYLENGVWEAYELPFSPSEGQFFRELLLNAGHKVIRDNEQVAVETNGTWDVYNAMNSPMDPLQLTSAGLDANGDLWLTHGYLGLLERAQLGRVTASEAPSPKAAPGLRVLGNPVQNGQLVLRAEYPFQASVSLQVFDVKGQQLPVQATNVAGNHIRARVLSFPAGWYVAVVVDGEQRYTVPFVVQW